MASAHQRRIVRSAGNAAGRGVRALSLAALLTIAPATLARAQAFSADRIALLESALPDVTSWLSEAGRPGWVSASALGLSPPLPLAGLARGGWSLADDLRGPAPRPFPGLVVGAPLVILDSLAVENGAGGDPSAFRSGLAEARPVAPTAPRGGKPRSAFGFLNGDFGANETTLEADRSDEANGVRIETTAGGRGADGPFGDAGRHGWGVGLEHRFGTQRLGGTFHQAATATSLNSGEQEAARGASGRIDYSIQQGEWQHALMMSRQWDERESFGGSLDPWSRRDAQENRVTLSSERRSGTTRVGAQADWSRARVARAGGPEFATISQEVWVGAWWRDVRPGRTASLDLGGGHNGGVDRLELAPRARIEWTREKGRLGLWGARLLEPAWHDLAPGEHPFLQSTWAIGGEAIHTSGAASVALTGMAGRTRDRVLIARLPMDEQWLRAGQARDPSAWNFAQFSGRGTAIAGPFDMGAEGSGLVSARTARQGRVDPAVTGRGWAGWSFRAFKGDLGVNLRAELDAVGPRATDEATPRPLPGFASGAAAVRLTLGDVVVTVRARNLEDRRRPDVWIDPATGQPALGPGRELRVSAGCKLFN